MPRVVVIGGGNAALVAAIAARERGVEVILLERAPYELRGGNSRFAGGGMRTVYDGVQDLLQLMPDLSESETTNTDFGDYTKENFLDDLGRLSGYRVDPDLAEKLVDDSLPTIKWMQSKGVRFLPLYRRQSFEVDGKQRFWGGLTVEAWGGGAGLVDALTDIAADSDVELRYSARAERLQLQSDGSLLVSVDDETIECGAVVLACGGFESNAAWRARYLGPNWDLAKVRGTRFNTGDGIEMAVALGAATRGHWSSCHAVAWDLNAPEFGDLDVGDSFQKHSYPLGIVVNARGERFVDEGADFRNYTYAKYGAEILKQPDQFAWQVFDGKVLGMLRDEYRIPKVTKVAGDSLEELAAKMENVDSEGFLRTVQAFNESVATDVEFDPAVRDGRNAHDGRVTKSNWSVRFDTPPYEAYAVTCGITFTFGGLHVDSDSRVLSVDASPIHNLYAAGELVGGLYYGNYPGGAGLTAGAVFGRTAGYNAARSAVEVEKSKGVS